MNYYIDTEFLEGTQDKCVPFLNFKYGETKPTIDLISIGIVAEDDREYYAISKEFNLKEAWNRSDGYTRQGDRIVKKYWIRENVLKPIWKELAFRETKENPKRQFITNSVSSQDTFDKAIINLKEMERFFTYKRLKKLIDKYGKTNKQIVEEIKKFVYNPSSVRPLGTQESINFYAYYADYHWVAFCWLFGKMMNLPKGFPMYCIDLKQELDNYITKTWKDVEMSTWGHEGVRLKDLKKDMNYPKQTNEHNALADAKWNKELHKFLINLSNTSNTLNTTLEDKVLDFRNMIKDKHITKLYYKFFNINNNKIIK